MDSRPFCSIPDRNLSKILNEANIFLQNNFLQSLIELFWIVMRSVNIVTPFLNIMCGNTWLLKLE